MSDQKSDNSFRWWEFYAVRYGMGTVVGAVIFFFLCLSNPTLKPLLFMDEHVRKIDGTQLTLFAAYGITYCYISSAPILVLHAGRFLLRAKSSFDGIVCRLAIVGFIPAASALFVAYNLRALSADKIFMYANATFLFTLSVWGSLVVVTTSISKSNKLFEFYLRLDKRRQESMGDMVNSYRHLREHGNSFLIVLFEFILAIILYTAGQYGTTIEHDTQGQNNVVWYVIILIAWTLPAGLVWVVGTAIERQFRDSEAPLNPQTKSS